MARTVRVGRDKRAINSSVCHEAFKSGSIETDYTPRQIAAMLNEGLNPYAGQAVESFQASWDEKYPAAAIVTRQVVEVN